MKTAPATSERRDHVHQVQPHAIVSANAPGPHDGGSDSAELPGPSERAAPHGKPHSLRTRRATAALRAQPAGQPQHGKPFKEGNTRGQIK